MAQTYHTRIEIAHFTEIVNRILLGIKSLTPTDPDNIIVYQPVSGNGSLQPLDLLLVSK